MTKESHLIISYISGFYLKDNTFVLRRQENKNNDSNNLQFGGLT